MCFDFRRACFIVLALGLVAVSAQKETVEPEVITEPRPGEEFVLVSGAGGGPITASKPAPRGLAKSTSRTQQR